MDRARLEEIAKLSDSSNHAAFEIGDLWNAIDELLDYVEELEIRLTAREEFEKELMNLINKFR